MTGRTFYGVGTAADGTPILAPSIFAPRLRRFVADQLRHLARAIDFAEYTSGSSVWVFSVGADDKCIRYDITTAGRAVLVNEYDEDCHHG